MRTAIGLTPYDTLTYNRPRPILHTAQQLALLLYPHRPTTGLTLYPYHPTTGLTPDPSPRGEGRNMPCCGVVGFVVAKRFVSFSPRGGIEVMLR